eukprot:2905466-Prymnesium_polylepis.1
MSLVNRCFRKQRMSLVTRCFRKQREQEQHARYWKQVAKQVDEWARVIIPGAYIVMLFMLFNLEMSDDYDSSSNAEM